MKHDASSFLATLWLLKRKTANGLLWGGSIVATALAILPLALVVFYLLKQGLPALNLAFFTHLPKPVGELGGGMANAIVGTLILIAISGAIGIPVGMLGGIYLAEFGHNRIGAAVRFTADVLASVPSIVIGILAYTIIVMPMHHFSALAGGVALGIIMIPMVMRTTEEIVRMVPMSQREASLALGATYFTTTFRIVMLSARGGVITGVLLAVARVAGESAPLLFTAMGSRYWSTSLVDQPIASLPVQIFNYATSPYDDWKAQAWAGALVLVVMIFLISVAARYATKGRIHLIR
jgi:phosphate transport system permease protein